MTDIEKLKMVTNLKIPKNPKTYRDVLIMYMKPNQIYSFDDIMDLMRKYYIPRQSRYVFEIENKTPYIIDAIKKVIKNGNMIQHIEPAVKTKYVGHYYERI